MGHGLTRNESFFFPDVTTEFERTLSRASTTGKSWYHHSETSLGSLLEQERRGVVSAIRQLDVRKNIKLGGGRMQTREKARAILGNSVVRDVKSSGK